MKSCLLLLFFLSAVAEAEVIQILHTNDLHTFLEGTNTGKGGYARLKTMLGNLKARASARNIPSLYLDGGDFGEGSSFFAADKGTYTFRTLDLLAPDAAVLGNHDHILGAEELATMMKRSGVKTSILSANLSSKKRNGLSAIAPTKDFELGNLKVRVIGLSTAEKHAQYTMPSAKIHDPVKTALPLLEKARKEKIDFVISLSHTGVDIDKELVRASSNLGLVVGGHDHLKFPEPRIEINKLGEPVAILQAGSHSAYVGQLLIDVDDNGKAKILSYKLHEVNNGVAEDPAMSSLVSEAKIERERFFGRSWDEVIGHSEIVLTGRIDGRMKNNRSCWSRHIARMTKESTGADIGMQFDVFQSDEIPAGPITFGKMIDNFVHFNGWEPRGWELTTLRLSGVELATLLSFLKKDSNEYSSSFEGIEIIDEKGMFRPYRPLEHSSKKKFVNGKPLKKFKIYTMALPIEVPRALEHSFPVIGKMLTRYQKTGRKVYYWEEMEKYIRRNSPLSCL